jgi:hypothetical protein
VPCLRCPALTLGDIGEFLQLDTSHDRNANFCRDDLTVEVIFFGEGPANGNVTLNKEASAGSGASPDVKAKL